MRNITCQRSAQRRGGYSLVELLVYLSVMVILAGALITTFLSLDTVLLRNKNEREITESASLALERMVRTIRNADSVNVPQSTFDTSPGELSVTEGATTTEFYISGGSLMMSINGVELGPLTSDEVIIDVLTFTHYIGSTTEMVRAGITMSLADTTASSTRTFYTSAVLRGSYE